MSKLRILLGLSGSEQSRYAAQTAWEIARSLGAAVDVSHVIDTRTAWELLRNEKPGFLGSGPYIAAYDALNDSLKSLASKLSLSYESQAAGRGIKGEFFIEEGNPVRKLCARAQDYDLLIIGHQPSGLKITDTERCHYIKYSVAEGLAHESSIPVLIVQSQCSLWDKLTLMMEVEHLNFTWLKACLEFARTLGIGTELELIGTGVREEGFAALQRDLVQELPELADVPIKLDIVKGKAVEDKVALTKQSGVTLDLEASPESMLVLPTRELGRDRNTVFDTPPDVFVRYLCQPAILLWPEEYKGNFAKTEVAARSASKRKEKVRYESTDSG